MGEKLKDLILTGLPGAEWDEEEQEDGLKEYDPGDGTLAIFDDLDQNDDTDYSVSIETTRVMGRQLLYYIRERQEIMRLLKIHPMSILTKEMKEWVKGLEVMFPDVPKPELVAEDGH